VAVDTEPAQQQSPAMARLEDQLHWYSRESAQNQRDFKLVKVAQLVAAAAIPVAAAFGAHPGVAAVLGSLVILMEGIQQLNQYQQTWIISRSTAESLKHEKYLYLAKAGPYGGGLNADVVLAERVEGLVAQEHAKWVSTRDEAEAATSGGGETSG
jgi:hypothetical protein